MLSVFVIPSFCHEKFSKWHCLVEGLGLCICDFELGKTWRTWPYPSSDFSGKVKVKLGMPPKNVMVLEVTGILGRGNIPSESEWCIYIAYIGRKNTKNKTKTQKPAEHERMSLEKEIISTWKSSSNHHFSAVNSLLVFRGVTSRRNRVREIKNYQGWFQGPPTYGSLPILFPYHSHMGVSKNRGTLKSSHFNRVFPYKPSILGVPLFLEIPISLGILMGFFRDANPSCIAIAVTILKRQRANDCHRTIHCYSTRSGIALVACEQTQDPCDPYEIQEKWWDFLVKVCSNILASSWILFIDYGLVFLGTTSGL